MKWAPLRTSEWILLIFFGYLAILASFFAIRPHWWQEPDWILVACWAGLFSLAQTERTRMANVVSAIRDWVPMAVTLVAFREMEVFLPARYNTALELAWLRLDDLVLNHWRLKQVIESLGPVIPIYLELCYLLVYGLGTYCLIVLWVEARRDCIDRFYVILLTGTLLSYALFPYFPSQPPRIAFPTMDPPQFNVIRRFNLFLLRQATIHSSVFPSAHVSSAFAAAWGMFAVLSKRKRIAWGVLIYALSVTVATVYGRYHYAADALAGFAISLVAAAVAILLQRRPNAA